MEHRNDLTHYRSMIGKTTLLAPVLLAGALATLSGCVVVHAPKGGFTYAGFNESTRAGPVTVTPLALIEDSRCPSGTQCTWPGQVRITAQIGSPAGTEIRELTLDQPRQVGKGRLVLGVVLPMKPHSEVIGRHEYRFGFGYDD